MTNGGEKRGTGPQPVSCIIPVFNGALYLQEALDSLFAQTHALAEIIVIDDGSTDATPEIIAALGDRVVARRQDNAGPAAARNHGLQLARSELVAFLDADDFWHPQKLARQLGRFDERPEIGVSVTYVQNFWIDELAAERQRFREHRISRPLPAVLAATMLARRDVFELVGGFNESLGFGHSTDWFLRAADCGVVVETLAEVLYHRRLHHKNRSRVLSQASRDEFLELVKRHLDRQRGKTGC